MYELDLRPFTIQLKYQVNHFGLMIILLTSCNIVIMIATGHRPILLLRTVHGSKKRYYAPGSI